MQSIASHTVAANKGEYGYLVSNTLYRLLRRIGTPGKACQSADEDTINQKVLMPSETCLEDIANVDDGQESC
jgi:hypothetical protein